MRDRKYLICPSNVYSADGDTYFISAQQLMKLYGVRGSECIIASKEYLIGRRHDDGLIKLYPRNDGNYKLPKTLRGAVEKMANALQE